MRIKRLNGMITVATQVALSDLQKISDRGYKTIICNRPDFEGDLQPKFDDLAKRAQSIGVETAHIPVHLKGITEQNKSDFYTAIENLPKPILAFCRSGSRPAELWSHYVDHMNAGNAAGPERRVGAMQAGALTPQARPVAGILRRENPIAKDQPQVVNFRRL